MSRRHWEPGAPSVMETVATIEMAKHDLLTP
jgi:hypothetical protein